MQMASASLGGVRPLNNTSNDVIISCDISRLPQRGRVTLSPPPRLRLLPCAWLSGLFVAAQGITGTLSVPTLKIVTAAVIYPLHILPHSCLVVIIRVISSWMDSDDVGNFVLRNGHFEDRWVCGRMYIPCGCVGQATIISVCLLPLHCTAVYILFHHQYFRVCLLRCVCAASESIFADRQASDESWINFFLGAPTLQAQF